MIFHVVFLIVLFTSKTRPEIVSVNDDKTPVRVNKCCEENELYRGKDCKVAAENEAIWRPIFSTEHGSTNIPVNYKFVPGYPDCGSKQLWPIYHYQNSTDKLRLLPNGVLRHYFDHRVPGEESILEVEVEDGKDTIYHDYEPGQYCLDKKIDEFVSEFAWVCAPEPGPNWTTSEFIMRNIVNPITHSIGLICYLIVAIVYFIMPTLRDLVGNIVTTISICLIVSQSADLIRILTVFNNHISLIITETICYITLLGAFVWLNCLGFYIWKTFKSRNVFLRITDGKKYCYYSAYAWSCTIILGVLAVFAHFTMDYPSIKPNASSEQQEEIGSLGIIIFFVPVAFSVLMDIVFFATTLKKINKMHTYGRIHHKLRHSFRMFLMLLLLMTVTWLFFLLSFFKYDGLVNCYIIVNAFQGPLVLYVCVFNQKHVAYLIKKTCCYQNCVCCMCCTPSIDTEEEWGDEMTAMNSGNY